MKSEYEFNNEDIISMKTKKCAWYIMTMKKKWYVWK